MRDTGEKYKQHIACSACLDVLHPRLFPQLMPQGPLELPEFPPFTIFLHKGRLGNGVVLA